MTLRFDHHRANENMAENLPDDAERKVTLEDFDDQSERPIAFEIDIEDPWITPSSTASFTITTVNDSDQDQIVSPAFVKGTSSLFGKPGIVVYNERARDFDVEAYAPPCFFEGADNPGIRTGEVDGEETVLFTREGHGPDTIPAGESRTEYFIVVDDPTVEGCFPPGVYEFGKDHDYEGASGRLKWELRIEKI